jgi:CheY-like chemotaxis protein
MSSALVIDDNRLTADGLCRMLEFLGVKASPAYGSRAAMLMLSQSVPDIIFLDINMPGVDGFEVMAYLRRLPQLAEIPVVFITSDDQPETAIKARKTGALLVIVKPASFQALEAVLRKTNLVE